MGNTIDNVKATGNALAIRHVVDSGIWSERRSASTVQTVPPHGHGAVI